MEKSEERLRYYFLIEKEILKINNYIFSDNFNKDIETVLNMIEEARKFITSEEFFFLMNKDRKEVPEEYFTAHDKLLKKLGE